MNEMQGRVWADVALEGLQVIQTWGLEEAAYGSPFREQQGTSVTQQQLADQRRDSRHLKAHSLPQHNV